MRIPLGPFLFVCLTVLPAALSAQSAIDVVVSVGTVARMSVDSRFDNLTAAGGLPTEPEVQKLTRLPAFGEIDGYVSRDLVLGTDLSQTIAQSKKRTAWSDRNAFLDPISDSPIREAYTSNPQTGQSARAGEYIVTAEISDFGDLQKSSRALEIYQLPEVSLRKRRNLAVDVADAVAISSFNPRQAGNTLLAKVNAPRAVLAAPTDFSDAVNTILAPESFADLT